MRVCKNGSQSCCNCARILRSRLEIHASVDCMYPCDAMCENLPGGRYPRRRYANFFAALLSSAALVSLPSNVDSFPTNADIKGHAPRSTRKQQQEWSALTPPSPLFVPQTISAAAHSNVESDGASSRTNRETLSRIDVSPQLSIPGLAHTSLNEFPVKGAATSPSPVAIGAYPPLTTPYTVIHHEATKPSQSTWGSTSYPPSQAWKADTAKVALRFAENSRLPHIALQPALPLLQLDSLAVANNFTVATDSPESNSKKHSSNESDTLKKEDSERPQQQQHAENEIQPDEVPASPVGPSAERSKKPPESAWLCRISEPYKACNKKSYHPGMLDRAGNEDMGASKMYKGATCPKGFCCSAIACNLSAGCGNICTDNTLLCATSFSTYPEKSNGAGCTCADITGIHCDRVATCHELLMPGGGVYCKCPSGFTGNGIVCRPNDQITWGQLAHRPGLWGSAQYTSCGLLCFQTLLVCLTISSFVTNTSRY